MVSRKRMMRTVPTPVACAHLPVVPSLGFIHGLFLYSLVGHIFSLQIKRQGAERGRRDGRSEQCSHGDTRRVWATCRYKL
jgi:hypothetical protein